MKFLWQEIYKLCLSILSTSINLIYSDNKEIIKNLSHLLKDISNEKEEENCGISLNYLSIPDTCKKLLKANQEELELLTQVYSQCCQIRSSDIIKVIDCTSFEVIGAKEALPSHFIESCSKFIRGISEQLVSLKPTFLNLC